MCLTGLPSNMFPERARIGVAFFAAEDLALVGPVVDMRSLVLEAIRAVVELLFAERTLSNDQFLLERFSFYLEWFFACVSPDVNFQVLMPRKLLPTFSTDMRLLLN